MIKVGTGVNIPDNKDNASLTIAAGVEITNGSVHVNKTNTYGHNALKFHVASTTAQGAIFERMKIISSCHHLNHFGDHY